MNWDEKLKQILDEIKNRYGPEERALIERAYEFAYRAHQGSYRLSGEPYIAHSLEVARMLYQREMDHITICAGLLHDILEDTSLDYQQLKSEFPHPIPELVEGVSKIGFLKFRSRQEQYVENIRKMILAMARDIRVIIIKLCDRLHNMRTLQYLSPANQKRISQDTLDIYAPLAHRLGMNRIKSELEDLAMYYVHPQEYKEIASLVAQKRETRENMVQRAAQFLKDYLGKFHVKAQVQGRTKHFYSIFRKMKAQNLSWDEIYDLTALRVITETVEDCWTALGRIHEIWPPIPGRFKDYISIPKENMYQSLHTTVVSLDGEMTEIQIRTAEMHRLAEEGVAAHWVYKEGKTPGKARKELTWLKSVTEWIKEIKDPADFLAALRDDVFGDVIFCFTPKGDVIELPRGSTPVDFAYHIHTEIGDSCSGAKVNKRFVPLNYRLNNGDIVEIVTSKSVHPSSDWLAFVKTPTARAKIRHFLRTSQFGAKIEEGKELLTKAIRAANIELSLSKLPKALEPYFPVLNVSSFDRLLAEIGFGNIKVERVLHVLKPPAPAPKQTITVARKKPKGVVVDGVDGIQVRLARCCYPIPGDDIVGFITIGQGVRIHKRDCPSLERTIKSHRPERSRLVQAKWEAGAYAKNRVSLRVVAQDRTGLLKDIADTISFMGINILGNSSKSFPYKNEAILKFLIEIKNKEQLNQLLDRLKSVPSVKSLSRVLR